MFRLHWTEAQAGAERYHAAKPVAQGSTAEDQTLVLLVDCSLSVLEERFKGHVESRLAHAHVCVEYRQQTEQKKDSW